MLVSLPGYDVVSIACFIRSNVASQVSGTTADYVGIPCTTPQTMQVFPTPHRRLCRYSLHNTADYVGIPYTAPQTMQVFPTQHRRLCRYSLHSTADNVSIPHTIQQTMYVGIPYILLIIALFSKVTLSTYVHSPTVRQLKARRPTNRKRELKVVTNHKRAQVNRRPSHIQYIATVHRLDYKEIVQRKQKDNSNS